MRQVITRCGVLAGVSALTLGVAPGALAERVYASQDGWLFWPFIGFIICLLTLANLPSFYS